MSIAQHPARRLVMAQLAEAGHAPTRDKDDSTGGTDHVDGEGIVEHTANSGLG